MIDDIRCSQIKMINTAAPDIIEECRAKNETVGKYSIEYGEYSVAKWIETERRKWEQNNEKYPMQDRKEFADICEGYVAERIDDDAAGRVAKALQGGAIHTADHLGGIYSPQSFQGDLFFGILSGADCVPCFCAGSVTLHSSTYGRGIQFITENGHQKLPLFAGKYAKYSASLAPHIEAKDVDRAIKRAGSYKNVSGALEEILSGVYDNKKIFEKSRFADQMPQIGWKLSAVLGYPFDNKPLCYIEAEEVSGQLFLLDIKNEESLAYKLILDKDILKELNRDDPGSECPLSALLFRGNDKKGHMFPMRLYPDGMLKGASIYNDELCIEADPDNLYKAVCEKRIFISSYLRAVMLCFARGFTWYGGIFQSNYLPSWQKRTAEALVRAGKHELSEEVKKWEASGYISGPIAFGHINQMADGKYAIFPAGPVEWITDKHGKETVENMIKDIKLSEAHALGSFEYYMDLVPPADREEGWENVLAEFLEEKLIKNTRRRGV